MPDLLLEQAHGGVVAGVDEAGRGCWAGPVVAAAVVLDQQRYPDGINDSKKVSPERREAIYATLMDTAQVGVGVISVEEIDRHNILQAAKYAMQQAVEKLAMPPDLALVDGNQLPALGCTMEAVIGGDGKSLSIAAASIIAKVTRDRMMAELHAQFPEYCWADNKGYGTKVHREALLRVGPCVHHRKSFNPVKAYLQGTLAYG